MRRLASGCALAVLAVSAAAAPAWAALKVYGATSNNASVFDGGSGSHVLDLGINVNGGAVGTTLDIRVKKRSEIVITFSAECSVQGTTDSWIDLDIVVDGVAVPPTNSDNAFCTGKGTDTNNEWATNAVSVAVKVDAGNRSIQVHVREGNPGASAYRFDDTSLVVIVPKG